MKTSVICSLLFLVLIGVMSGVFAKEINLTYPNSVISGQIFQVNLTLINFTDGVYDVKIDFYNISTSNRLSDMYNNGTWKSTSYYFNNATNVSENNNTSFLLNITENYNGTANITVSIKKDGTSSPDTFSGYLINITPAIIVQPPTCIQNWSCSAWSSCSSSSQTRTCTDTNNCGNTTGKPAESQSCTMPSVDTYIQLNWTDEIFSDEEFEIEIDAFNLLSYNYDIKVWMEFKSNSTMLSERYDSSDSEWKSGTYYINNFFTSSGNRTKDIKLRLKEDYQNLDEEVYIYAKLRRTDNEAVIDDASRTIRLLKAIASSTTADTDTNTQAITTNAVANSDDEKIIVLGDSQTETTKKNSNSIIYKSKMEYIKDYAPYALSAICIVVIIFLMLDKPRKNRE